MSDNIIRLRDATEEAKNQAALHAEAEKPKRISQPGLSIPNAVKELLSPITKRRHRRSSSAGRDDGMGLCSPCYYRGALLDTCLCFIFCRP